MNTKYPVELSLIQVEKKLNGRSKGQQLEQYPFNTEKVRTFVNIRTLSERKEKILAINHAHIDTMRGKKLLK